MQNPVGKFLAKQLANPSGFWAVLVARSMNRANRLMYDEALNLLNPAREERWLELGFGSGLHIGELLDRYTIHHYTGTEISSAMLQMAQKANRLAVQAGKVDLKLGADSLKSLNTASYDSILSINTVYFWTNPDTVLQNLYKLSKPGGKLVLAWNSTEFLAKQSYARQFQKYSLKELQAKVEQQGWSASTGSKVHKGKQSFCMLKAVKT